MGTQDRASNNAQDVKGRVNDAGEDVKDAVHKVKDAVTSLGLVESPPGLLGGADYRTMAGGQRE